MQELPRVEPSGESRPLMSWDSWGVREERRPLDQRTASVVQTTLGISGSSRSEARVAPNVRPSTLTDERRGALEALVGAEHVATDDDVCMHYLSGKSTLDLLARRGGGVQDAPDAVVFPGDAAEVEALLRYCTTESIAVVPFGGGTSVVGGVDPVREWFDTVIAIATRRMDTLSHLDDFSRTATLGAGVTGPRAEELLAAHGLSLGHYPQSFAFATIGGFAATRSSGQASAGYGRFDDMVEALTVATPIGITTVGRAPASAAGPDLRQVFLGSEGTLGIITSVTVRVHAIPQATAHRSWWFPDFASGSTAFRELATRADRPTVMRLSDEIETGIDAALSSTPTPDTRTGGATSIALFEGMPDDVEARAAAADAVAVAAGGLVEDPGRAREWEKGRFDSPYLRDALLDAGALAETLETATSWRELDDLRTRVRKAIVEALTAVGTPPIVMCHISHVYDTGASLYFTVVCAAGHDPSANWRSAKDAASRAISDAGATVTHHHGVGRDHRPWMTSEIGPVGTALLRGMKAAVDPAGVLNPGKLIP
ncbi:MAG: FAD-binding oxidoreductase [Rhodococcus sp. (in: high G+C Gram-positive bacteria)]